MESATTNGAIYEFDGFRLVPNEELLLRDGKRVTLTARSFSVLRMLVERHGHLVTKSELIDTIWDDAFVEEGSLSKAIWRIRQALEDTSKERFIQTVPRKGYRFVFPVSVVTNGSGAFRSIDLGVVDESDNSIVPQTEEQVTSLAENIDDPGNHAEIELALHSTASRSRNWRGAAAFAGVAVVLLAAVSLYTAFYGSFTTRVGPSRERGTENEEAYNLYRQAENLSQKRLPEETKTAMDYLNQAVTLDPNFARAWTAKAHLHNFMVNLPGADGNEQYRKSMDAIRKALAIDPNLSEAHSALCFNRFRYEFDFAGAESACKRAVELDPDSSVGHMIYATFLFSRGRADQSIAEAREALNLQPLALDHQKIYALALYYARRYEEEETQWKRLKELTPTDGYIYMRLFNNAALQRNDARAFAYLIEKLKLDKVDNETMERFRNAYAESGLRGVNVERIKHPELALANGPFNVACLYASVGDKDKAFEYLEQAYKERNHRIAVLQVEPQLDPLRDDPRYVDLVHRVFDH
jgi:DNA-binding winged helix-turn-helix (wHTH) protein/Tfp pilus assembly protein PilF